MRNEPAHYITSTAKLNWIGYLDTPNAPAHELCEER
jgi:hypothetical protein